MTSSLVGSEMCIRDRVGGQGRAQRALPPLQAQQGGGLLSEGATRRRAGRADLHAMPGDDGVAPVSEMCDRPAAR
eukprot:12598313-Prorocentrum_lima.AAC.1